MYYFSNRSNSFQTELMTTVVVNLTKIQPVQIIKNNKPIIRLIRLVRL